MGTDPEQQGGQRGAPVPEPALSPTVPQYPHLYQGVRWVPGARTCRVPPRDRSWGGLRASSRRGHLPRAEPRAVPTQARDSGASPSPNLPPRGPCRGQGHITPGQTEQPR